MDQVPEIDEDLAALNRPVEVAEGEILLQTTELTVKFGGLVALGRRDVRHQAR